MARRSALAFWAYLGGALLAVLVSHRSPTQNGSDAVEGTAATVLGQLAGAITVGCAVSLALWPVRQRNAPAAGRSVLLGVWGMAFVLFLSGLVSPMPSTQRSYLISACGVTAIVTGVQDWRILVKWSKVIGRIITLGSIAGLILAPKWSLIGRTFDYLGNPLPYDRTLFGLPRLIGFSSHPNSLSIIACTVFIVEAAYRDPGPQLWRRAGLVGSALCIVLAQSNTAYIAVAIGSLVVLAVRRPGFRLGIGATVTAGLISLMIDPSLLIPKSLTSSGYVSSISGRTEIWTLALNEWARHPWLGYGPNIWSTKYLNLYVPATEQFATNAHNQLFQTLSDSGLMGATFLLVLVVGLLFNAFRALPLDRGLSLGLVVALLINGITETPFRPSSTQSYAMIVTIALVVAAARAAQSNRPVAEVASGELPMSGAAMLPYIDA